MALLVLYPCSRAICLVGPACALASALLVVRNLPGSLQGSSQSGNPMHSARRHTIRAYALMSARRSCGCVHCGHAGQDGEASTNSGNDQWVEDLRKQRPCFSIGGNFPFVANENANAAAAQASERCKASKTPPPPPPYTGWEAFWMERLGRPGMSSPPNHHP